MGCRSTEISTIPSNFLNEALSILDTDYKLQKDEVNEKVDKPQRMSTVVEVGSKVHLYSFKYTIVESPSPKCREYE